MQSWNATHHREEWAVNPRVSALVSALVTHRWAIVASMLLSSLVAATWAGYREPEYVAETVVVPVTIDQSSVGLGGALGQLGGLASLAGLTMAENDTAIEEAFAVLGSRQFAEQFIRDFDLLPRFFPTAKRATMSKGHDYFESEIVSVSRDRRTGLATIGVRWTDRLDAATWANEIVARVNAEMRSRAIQQARLSLQYLEQERDESRLVETREAINRLIEAQIRREMLASVNPDYAFRVIEPAVPPDEEDTVGPGIFLTAIFGAIVGFLVGSLAVGCLAMWRLYRADSRSSE